MYVCMTISEVLSIYIYIYIHTHILLIIRDARVSCRLFIIHSEDLE